MTQQSKVIFGEWVTSNLHLNDVRYTVQPAFLPFWDIATTDKDFLPRLMGDREALNTMQVYAGYNYRRKTVSVVKTSSRGAQPFNSSFFMYPDIQIDPWELYESTALRLYRDKVQAYCEETGVRLGDDERSRLRVAVTQKVYFPCYVFAYESMGLTWLCIVNGVTGDSNGQQSSSIPKAIVDSFKIAFHGKMLFQVLRPLFSGAVLGIIQRFPPLALTLAFVVGIQVWFQRRKYHEDLEEWKEERDRHRRDQQYVKDEWKFRGSYDGSNEESGSSQSKEQRNQWNRSSTNNNTGYSSNSSSNSGERKKKSSAETDMSRQNYYEILGLGKGKGSSTQEISDAFRRELFKWHPDHASESEKEYATRRTQIIIEAYKILRNYDKKRAYDRSL